MALSINADRLWEDLMHLGDIVDADASPYTRRAFTQPFLDGRQWLRRRMHEGGLTDISTDAAGNLSGRMEGSDPALLPILVGSHTDTVVGGGRFDGALGVLAGLEALRAIQEAGVQLQHSIELVDFLSEEPSDYGGLSLVGSRGMAGTLTPEMLDLQNPEGERLTEAIRRMGGRPDALVAPLRRKGDVAAFLELHIEQGPVLEEKGVPVGIVTGIVGIRRFRVSIVGRPDHAGTTPMNGRADALAAAAEVIGLVEALSYDASRTHPFVGTVGRITASPNTPNVVPGDVTLIVEFRSSREDQIDEVVSSWIDRSREAVQARGLTFQAKRISAISPVGMSGLVVDAAKTACEEGDLPYVLLPSGAGHDAMQMARIAPTGMLFVPCLRGRSHCPEEWASRNDVARGALALALTLVRLDRTL